MPQQGGYLPERLHLMTDIRDYSFVTSAFTSERILRDYADKKAVCFASDSGLAIEACECPQCIEGNLLYPVLTAIALERRINDIRTNGITALSRTIEKIADLITPLLEDETIEPTSYLGEQLIELLDIEMTEEIEVSLVVTYTGTITVPKGTDLSDLIVDNETLLDVTLDGKNVGDVSWSEEEFARF
jgi:hypothetical protein